MSSDTAQWIVLLILVPVGVWYGARYFAEGFREGWAESHAERAAKREAENEELRQAKRRHPSSGTKPWAPEDARELDQD